MGPAIIKYKSHYRETSFNSTFSNGENSKRYVGKQ